MRRRSHFRHPVSATLILVAAFAVSVNLPAVAGEDEAAELTYQIESPEGFTLHHPPDWSRGPQAYANALTLVNHPVTATEEARAAKAPQILVLTEKRRDHDAALQRLKQIEAGHDVPVTYLEIGGWPAFQRRVESEVTLPDSGRRVRYITSLTVIAADAMVVKLSGSVEADGDLTPLDAMELMGRNLTFAAAADATKTQDDLERLRAMPAPRAPAPLPTGSEPPVEYGPGGRTTAPALELEGVEATDPGRVQRIQRGFCNDTGNRCADDSECPGSFCNDNSGDAEIELAVSTDGRNIVVGNNSRDFATSTDGGRTFPFRGLIPDESGNGNGDPSLAYGASGNFYYAFIDRPTATTCSTGISVSTNGGTGWNFRARATQCNDNCFPDQEHIAADRWNLSNTGQDQVYSTWRDFTGGGCGGSGTASAGPEVPTLVCSTDSANNWSAKIAIGGNSERFPRVSVDRNGFVYVVWLDGNNIMVDKRSSCQSGLVQQPNFPVMAESHNPVDCSSGVPGLDRCNGRNTLASPVIAHDENDADHMFLAYASNTVAGTNEDILMIESTDGGENWSDPVRVNSNLNARRFMPWVCSVGGEAHVTWYDRRFQLFSDNSLTDFFRGSAFNEGGDLVAGDEVRLTPVSDSQCLAGATMPTQTSSWPSAVNAPIDSESCSAALQPALGGVCQSTGTCMGGFCSQDGVTPCTSNAQCNPLNGNRCDFSDCGGNGMGVGPNCQCNAGINETCNNGRGGPKYGDYNGAACAAGRVYASWASATAPSYITPQSTRIDAFFTQTLVCCEPQIQVPAPVDFGLVCGNDPVSEVLNVCNTGKEDLVVSAITSSSSEFSVSEPLAGYPVVISPDFCFPFDAQFDPVFGGTETLTIETNDPVNPMFEVPVSGTPGEGDTDVVIADDGDFGQVCLGDFKDLDLQVANSGDCPLFFYGVNSSSTEFIPPGIEDTPVEIAAGGSLTVPVRYQPDDLGDSSAVLTVISDTPEVEVNVTGTTPPPDIEVTGSTDFGDVCADDLAEKVISVCNLGACDLAVTNASIDCPDFTIINNPFPGIVSPDFCVDLTIRFTPTTAGEKMCTLTIDSDDPDEGSIDLTLTGNTPLPMIDVPPDLGFPPTVLQDVAACSSGELFPVSSTGECPLEITEFTISDNAEEYSIDGLPSFPILLEPGHIAGEGALHLVFEPDVLDRARQGQVSVTYVSEPVTGEETTVVRNLCGEGVRTGARVLVTHGGVPLDEVKRIKLQRINANRNGNRVDTVDNSMNLLLQTETPPAPCGPFQYHREYSTVSNPIQLLPGFYQVTVQARIDGQNRHKTVGFNVDSCDFNSTVVVDF